MPTRNITYRLFSSVESAIGEAPTSYRQLSPAMQNDDVSKRAYYCLFEKKHQSTDRVQRCNLLFDQRLMLRLITSISR